MGEAETSTLEAFIELTGNDVLCRSPGSAPSELRIAGESARALMVTWGERYNSAVSRGDAAELLTIARELWSWLDATGWVSAWLRTAGARSLYIQVADALEPLATALLDVPWELLADKSGHLADDPVQLFEVARRIGRASQPVEPRHSDLQALFMAAAPSGQSALGFESEEAGILQATARLPMHLLVEESGALEFLSERLVHDGPFEALHLSCHGDIHTQLGPVLVLEDEGGGPALAGVGAIVGALGDGQQRPPLVFLSACRTAEQEGRRSSEPFVRALVRAGVANVLGWDGSVYDSDAAKFAEVFYRELAAKRSVVYAAAKARQELRAAELENRNAGRHWHLARLYLGAHGGAALIANGKPRRRVRGAEFEREFLDVDRKEVPVASRREFVGRRRQLQDLFLAFRAGNHAGVLIHGMGNLGKSSLAARVASRLQTHKTIVIFERYDALTVLDRVLEAVPAEQRAGARATWREAVLGNEGMLEEALESLLTDSLDQHPMLLIIDDLDRILEPPVAAQVGATQMQVKYRATYAAILTAFAHSQTASRLLLTSRYRFKLLDSRQADLTDALFHIHVPPMPLADQDKQWRASLCSVVPQVVAGIDAALVGRALQAAQGNPGLQAALLKPLLKGEHVVTQQALAAIEHFLQHGVPPETIRALLQAGVAQDQENAILTFFERMAFETYRAALTATQELLLRAACLFRHGLGIPRAAVEAAGVAVGVEHVSAALDRLLSLGLMDDFGAADGTAHVAANSLVRPLVTSLTDALSAAAATAAVPVMGKCWRDAEGRFRPGVKALEITRMARLAVVEPQLLSRAAAAAGRYLFGQRHDAPAAMELLGPTFRQLKAMGALPATDLMLVMFDCAERLGDIMLMEDLLQQMTSDESDPDFGSVLLRLARVQLRQDPSMAEVTFARAARAFAAVNDARSVSIARGGLADILQARGQLDEALRIREEEELPVYERLGDVRSRAVTQAEIADILRARGQLDEALRILEEVLSAFQSLGDVRSKAVTQGKIADILQARGQLDEALRILEEVLSAFQRLGDVRSKVATQGKIADIMQARGQLEEALRIREEEELPVYERLGDALSMAVTRGRIADILLMRGRLDEALRIREELQLPVFQRLGDALSIAVTRGKIADILEVRGQLDEALSVLKDEVLPVFQRLGDVRSMAVAQGQIANILQSRGQLDEALRVLKDEVLPVFQRLGDVRSMAGAQRQIAKNLQSRGQLDEALRVLKDEVLPVFRRLGDVRSTAVTQGQIADILQACGQFDEALCMHEARLLVAERIQDIDSLAHIYFCMARIRLQRGDATRDGLQTICKELQESFALNVRLGRADAIGRVGVLLAGVLVDGGLVEQVPQVLSQAESAFVRLGDQGGIAQIRQVRHTLLQNGISVAV